MPGWTLIDTHPTRGRTFKRPLDAVEHWFFWYGLFDGAADGLQYCQLRLLNGSRDAYLFSDANIVKAWLSTKRRYPLAGATVQGVDDAPFGLDTTSDSKGGDGTRFVSRPYFVVEEHDLGVIRPREIVFGNMAREEAQQRMQVIMEGPRPLSRELLMQLYVFRETDPKKTDVLHLMILVAHCVTDRVAINTFVRCLLDTLARGGGAEPAQIPLEERVAMLNASMNHEPQHMRSFSSAVRRWRRAAGMVILQIRMARRQGGYTLPCRLTRSTPHTAAKSGLVTTSLSHTQTTAVIANCRLHGITFGNAFIVLSQVAMTRVLYRRYLRGEISEEEWAYRKRQPYLGGGPLNLRRYLDRGWFERGGGGESMLSLGFFLYQLPFMTTVEATRQPQRVLSDGAPLFSDLLAFDRFLHRVGLVKKQAASFFSHPLFFEIIHAVTQAEGEHTRVAALQWMQGVETRNRDEEVLAATDIPMVWAFGGSSAGSLDSLSPTEFPLPLTHPLSPYSSVLHPAKAGYVTPPLPLEFVRKAETTPKVVVENSMIHIHSRPAELYLTADSLAGQMNMQIFYDRNVFEEEVVREWLEEVKGAVLWYLGQTHRPRRVQQHCGDGNGQNGHGEGMQAKL